LCGWGFYEFRKAIILFGAVDQCLKLFQARYDQLAVYPYLVLPTLSVIAYFVNFLEG